MALLQPGDLFPNGTASIAFTSGSGTTITPFSQSGNAYVFFETDLISNPNEPTKSLSGATFTSLTSSRGAVVDGTGYRAGIVTSPGSSFVFTPSVDIPSGRVLLKATGNIGLDIESFDADYQAVLDFGTAQGFTLPASSVQTAQNTLITSMKAAGAWNKMDAFFVFAGDQSDFARINWVTLTTASLVNTVAFTANQGFKGNGTDSYIKTNHQLNSATTLANSASGHTVFFLDDDRTVGSDSYLAGVEAPTSDYRLSSANSTLQRQSHASNLDATSNWGVSRGVVGIHKNSGADVLVHNETTFIATFYSTPTSTRTVTSPVILGSSVSGVTFNNTRFSIASMGAPLTGSGFDNITDYVAALNTYMNTVSGSA